MNRPFIGDIVKLNPSIERSNQMTQHWINTALKENWLWLIVGMNEEELDYVIKPMYLDSEGTDLIELGGDLLVLYDEIVKVDISNTEELFLKLKELSTQ